jgi:prolyl-tRNA editing enzyme YbaK/EbsC (Cys-tRNA(Pro) deacylase)
MNYHPVTKQIIDLLTQHNLWFETFEHPPVRTSKEAAQIRDGYTMEQGAKALILRIKYSKSNKKFVMLVLPGDLQFDKNKVKQLLNCKDIRFATPQEIADITNGILPGGVPPWGNLFNLEVFVDPKLLENEKIIFNAGDRSFSVGMKSQDYLTVVNPQVESIT